MTVSHGKEYFPSSVYGPASRRVVADGQPVPRGGGQYLVGKPYTIAGRTYYPRENQKTQVGYASWYGDAFHGRLTANGEIYDRDSFTAASPTMPLPSYARVTNLRNNHSMIVRVNDRGPYASNRIMDVSRRVAEALDYKRYGTTLLKVEYVGRASVAGSDDARLYATLRTDMPATSQRPNTMVAQAPSRLRVASNTARNSDFAPSTRSHKSWTDDDTSTASRRAVPDEDHVARPMTRGPVVLAGQLQRLREDRAFRYRGREENLVSRHRVVDGEEERRGQAETIMHPDHRRTVVSRSLGEDRLAKIPFGHSERMAKARSPSWGVALPPSRPLDLGTIPGAASQIHARSDQMTLRIARSRDD